MGRLTIKQEKFCQAYVETGNASEAYRQSYSTKNMRTTTVNRTAFTLLENHKITARVAELQHAALERHNVTIDTLLLELEEARRVALSAETPQASAAVGATMGKAKIMGLDKQLVDVTSNGESISPTRIELVAPDVDTKG